MAAATCSAERLVTVASSEDWTISATSTEEVLPVDAAWVKPEVSCSTDIDALASTESSRVVDVAYESGWWGGIEGGVIGGCGEEGCGEGGGHIGGGGGG
jgi:hypothetical protein